GGAGLAVGIRAEVQDGAAEWACLAGGLRRRVAARAVVGRAVRGGGRARSRLARRRTPSPAPSAARSEKFRTRDEAARLRASDRASRPGGFAAIQRLCAASAGYRRS